MNGWRGILSRALDGEPLTDQESALLQTALADEQHRSTARQWIQFELTLTGCLQEPDPVEGSRERLTARIILKTKHAEVVGEAMSPSREFPPLKPNVLPKATVTAGIIRWMRRHGTAAATVVAILLILTVTWWPDSTWPAYAGPTAEGSFRILGATESTTSAALRRGDRIVSGGAGARIETGRYCRLELDPHTDVTMRGEPHREVVELHQGHLKAHITPEHGQFRVLTPLGAVVVKGTEFETTVEYPNGLPGDLSMNGTKRVIVTVAVLSGAVQCELGDMPSLLETGSQRVFAQDVESRRTSGEVTAVTDGTVTLKVKDNQTETFQVGDNKLTGHEAGELHKGDRITIAWFEKDGRRWIEDIDGEGVVEGTVTSLGDAWLEVETSGDRRIRLRAPWRGGNPADGGGPDRDIVRKIASVHRGDRVAVTWTMPEGKRIVDVRLREATNLTKAPSALHGFSGRVIGRLVSKDVEKGELTLKIVKVDRVWKNNKATDPQSAEGRTLKIEGVFGRFLDVLLTLKEGDGVQAETKHVRGDGLQFLGEGFQKVEIEPEPRAEPEPGTQPAPADRGAAATGDDSPAGLQGFRGILIGKLVSKDVEKGTLILEMEKVKRVWEASKAPAPEKSVGEPLRIEGITGRFLDTLLVLQVGDRIELEAFHVRGPALKFPGEWLKKAE